MLLKILSRTFWSWWDNLSYSLINSFMASLNPFFLIIISTIMWMLTEDAGLIISNLNFFSIVFGASFLCLAPFPTTAAAYAMQEKLIDGTMVSYFKEYWIQLRKVFLRTFIITLINGIIGGLLSFSILFYYQSLNYLFPVNFVLIFISLWFYIYVLISQINMVPLLYRDDLKIFEYYLFAFYMTAKKGAVIISVAFITLVSFLIFCVPLASKLTAVIPIITYMGYSATLHAWTFRFVNGEVPPEEEEIKRHWKELFTPFFALFKKKNRK